MCHTLSKIVSKTMNSNLLNISTDIDRFLSSSAERESVRPKFKNLQCGHFVVKLT